MISVTLEPQLKLAPWWRAYLRAMAFVLPGILAWGFACVFLVPKLREVCDLAGMESIEAAWLGDFSFFLVAYGRSILIGLGVILAVLEVFGRRWARHRGVVLGSLAWVVNVLVLAGLLALLTLVLMAAPMLMPAR